MKNVWHVGKLCLNAGTCTHKKIKRGGERGRKNNSNNKGKTSVHKRMFIELFFFPPFDLSLF